MANPRFAEVTNRTLRTKLNTRRIASRHSRLAEGQWRAPRRVSPGNRRFLKDTFVFLNGTRKKSIECSTEKREATNHIGRGRATIGSLGRSNRRLDSSAVSCIYRIPEERRKIDEIRRSPSSRTIRKLHGHSTSCLL